MRHPAIGRAKGIESAREIERAVLAAWIQRSPLHLQRFLFGATLKAELQNMGRQRKFDVEALRPQAIEAIARDEPEWGIEKASIDRGNPPHEARGGSLRARSTAGNDSRPRRVVPIRGRRGP